MAQRALGDWEAIGLVDCERSEEDKTPNRWSLAANHAELVQAVRSPG